MSYRSHLNAALVFSLAVLAAPLLPAHAQPRVSADSSPVLAPAGSAPLPFDSVVVGMLARLHAVPLIVGARSARVEGKVGDTVIVRGVRHGEFVRIPAERIEWMQVSTGRGWTRGRVIKGALIGAAAGLAAATIVQQVADGDESQTRGKCPFSLSGGCERSIRLFAIGLGVGILGGAALGAEMGDERWRPVRVP